MEANVETSTIEVRLLGPMSVSIDSKPVALPASRKVRGLVAYLALHRAGVSRTQLCDLLWDAPNDPRGELRWSLSKIRGVLDTPGRRRVLATDDLVRLDLSDCTLDAFAVEQAAELEGLPVERLRELAALFQGDFVDGLQIESAPFTGWLLAQRHRFRTCRIAILERLVRALPRGSKEVFEHLQTWLEVAPFDPRAHELLMLALAEAGRVPDAEAHLVNTIRRFETEGLDWLPLREAWRAARTRYDTKAASPSIRIESAPQPVPSVDPPSHRASIAVMPFADHTGANNQRGGLADGFAEDLITGLAKLRAFFVFARGTMFALDAHKFDAKEVARLLNVDYIVSGSVRRRDSRLIVTAELADARTGRIGWTEQFEAPLQDAFTILGDINNRIVAAIAAEIETTERNRAALKPPNSLDAWEAYHRGLWHVYRFNAIDNERAEHFFRTSLRLDPTFSRAYAGLSFTHFQNAFLHRVQDRHRQVDLAFEAAGKSLQIDERDPAAHWAMGRAYWLRGQQTESLLELERSVELSPNFALGHYMLAFVHGQSGDALRSIESADYSRRLSPFDPLQFGMLSSRAIAHVRLGQFQEAAEWAVRAAARPNAHVHILAIAAHCLAAANRLDEARAFAALSRKQQPHYTSQEFLAAFRFAPDAAEIFRNSAASIGLV